LSRFEYSPFRVAYSWPSCAAVTSSIKPEVHNNNISQRRAMKQNRTTAAGNTYKNLVKIGRVISEICSRTHRHTYSHKHAHHNTPLRKLARRMNVSALLCSEKSNIHHLFIRTVKFLIRPHRMHSILSVSKSVKEDNNEINICCKCRNVPYSVCMCLSVCPSFCHDR